MAIVLNKENKMYRVIDKRGSGKTGRLFLIAKDTGATIVCSNPAMM
ncbi:hypothetical protein [Terrisporobacter sp.]|nr:hypothetical protein [Terrisporobacter sp.]MDY4735189.1 hypothetical protein [Terrisporobacter sp.]